MDSLEELFCHIDDFCQQFEPKWHSLLLGKGIQHRQRQRSLSLSEIMTLKVFADRGYVSNALAERLFETCGIEFFAKPKRNMKNHLMRLTDKLLARKRAIIETVIDQLKNISQIEHSRHRSPANFMVNVLCGLIAYCHQPKKPSLNLDFALPPSA